jgi:glucose-6-phosphate isomerase
MADATGGTAGWSALEEHARAIAGRTLTSLFSAEPDRLERLALDVGPLHFDFSKTHVDSHALELLIARAQAADFDLWRERLFAGEIVNPSEARAATHAAERGSPPEAAAAEAARAREQMYALVRALEQGAFGPIRHVLHIGIGGSALGPALVLDALRQAENPLEVAVISNIDGAALEPFLARFDPQATLVVIVSKTFTTMETMTNAKSALEWLARGGVGDPLVRTIAVTAAPARAEAFGVPSGQILSFGETVGGRYSLWSAVGVPIAFKLGQHGFEQLLAGARAMDEHFRTAPLATNAPFLAAAIDVWYSSVRGAGARGVFAYDERLRLLPSFLQQLEMESNGKRVTRDGAPVPWPTAPVTWGGVGTDAQHAVFQMLHQGTQVIPVEFLAVKEPGHSLGPAHHQQLLANCFAQGAALMRGRTYDEALALSGGDPALAAAKTFPGNRPSTTILLEHLDAESLGRLLAFYEHRTFAASCLLGINAFDQWGVELGKEMAKAIAEQLEGGSGGDFDPSTADLLARALG